MGLIAKIIKEKIKKVKEKRYESFSDYEKMLTKISKESKVFTLKQLQEFRRGCLGELAIRLEALGKNLRLQCIKETGGNELDIMLSNSDSDKRGAVALILMHVASDLQWISLSTKEAIEAMDSFTECPSKVLKEYRKEHAKELKQYRVKRAELSAAVQEARKQTRKNIKNAKA